MRVSLIAMLAVMLNGCLNPGSEELEKAKQLMEEGDFLRAAPMLEFAADKDNAEAQYLIGSLYLNGKGVEKNDTIAFEYFKKSANQNNVDAWCAVGKAYGRGRGVQKDINLGFKYLERSAKEGHIQGMVYTLISYQNGIGVEPNDSMVMDYGVKIGTNQIGKDSLDNEVIMKSRVNLANRYLTGGPELVDTIEAFKWVFLYNEDKHLLSTKSQANMFKNIRGTYDLLSPEELDAAAARAEQVKGGSLLNRKNLFIIDNPKESQPEGDAK